MDPKDDSTLADPEINAISIVYDALKSLDADAQIRVIEFVVGKLRIRLAMTPVEPDQVDAPSSVRQTSAEPERAAKPGEDSTDPSAGINVVAQKWMTRSGINATQLGKIFSVGGDEIDLIAESVPGNSKTKRMHGVILLKGVAAYLGSGAARVSHDQIKETCLHYDAYDSPNFATRLKGLSAEVSGSKEHGYTLTPRGLAAATELVKQMIQGDGA